MIYKLSKKGEKMWPGYTLEGYALIEDRFGLRICSKDEHKPWISVALGPRDTQALLELGLIEEKEAVNNDRSDCCGYTGPFTCHIHGGPYKFCLNKHCRCRITTN